jgi:nicotinamide riboside kinase
MKKAALIGTHGIRKSTHCHGLIHYLKQRKINAELLGEVARNSPFPINEETTESSQRWILYNQLSKELEYELHNQDILICDRASLDNYSYFVEAFGKKDDLDILVKNHMNSYDAIIRIPLNNGKIDDDGVRSTSLDFQRRIDNRVVELLDEFNINYTDFESIEQIGEYISDKCGYSQRA